MIGAAAGSSAPPPCWIGRGGEHRRQEVKKSKRLCGRRVCTGEGDDGAKMGEGEKWRRGGGTVDVGVREGGRERAVDSLLTILL